MLKIAPRLTRREWLQFLGALSAAAALPAGCMRTTTSADPAFFSASERRALGALSNAVLPPDDTPGGEALGTVAFIERLLTAFDTDPPGIFAGGPYSGRQPFSDQTGAASANFPSNDFSKFLPLDRVSEAGWRLRLYGTAGFAGGPPNQAITGPVIGLRDLVKQGLGAAMKNAPAPLETLAADALKSEFAALDAPFRDLLIELTSHAAFAAPEYGGNTNLGGWKLTHYEGDSQPLGYSLYDEAAGKYRERPEAPMSTANPGPDPMPVDDASRAFLMKLVSATNGKVFP